MDGVIIFGAKYLIFVIVALFCISVVWYLYRTKRWWFVSKVVLAGILSLIISRIAQVLYYNPRPFVTEHVTPLVQHAADNGFPSDHVLLAGTLAFLLWSIYRPLGIIVLVLAFLVGIARVLAGVHHSLDIAASLVISLLSVFLINLFFDWLRRRKRSRKEKNLAENSL